MSIQPDHPFSTFIAFVSAGSAGLGIATEIIRTYQEIHYLCGCYDCVGSVQGVNVADAEGTCESAYFISNTDIPYQPGAPITSPLWHIWTSVILFIIFLTEIPGVHWPTNKIGEWCPIFGPDSTVWATGALEILIGLDILGMPAALMGNYSEIWLRYITGWLLVGVGTVLLFFGMLKGSTIRIWRGQTDAPGGGGPDPGPIAVKAAWGELRGNITSMMGTNVVMGSFMNQVSAMDAAVGDL